MNTCLDRLRSQKWQLWRKRPSPEDEALILAKTASRRPEAEERCYGTEITARIDAALLKLSGRQRAVFALRHYEDRSLEEIGQILGSMSER